VAETVRGHYLGSHACKLSAGSPILRSGRRTAPRSITSATDLVDRVIPRVPVRQWVLSLPIPLRLLLAAQPKLVTPVLQVVHRAPRACRRWSSCSGWLRWCPDLGCT